MATLHSPTGYSAASVMKYIKGGAPVEMPAVIFEFTSTLDSLISIAGYLVGMLTTSILELLTLSFLVALSFLLAIGLYVAPIVLPPAMYSLFWRWPKLSYATIVGLTYMGMTYMVDKSASISTPLLGLAAFINDYHLVYLVTRFVIVLALALWLLVSKFNLFKAAVIIALAVVLTTRLPGTTIEKPDLINESPFVATSSTLGFNDFIRFSDQMRVEHKMNTDKIISRFTLLIEESNGAIMSFLIHTVMILLTLIGGMVYYVWDQYPLWIKKSNSEVKNFVSFYEKEMKNFILNRISFGMFGKKDTEDSTEDEDST